MPSPIEATNLAGLAGISHGFFTREGGVSSGIYASLNCGLGSQDEREKVLENRARVADHLGAQNRRVVTVYQIHSPEVVRIDKAPAPDVLPKADAIVTTTPGLAIGSLTADCTPVLFADPTAGVIACAHAGWRGAVAGVIEATLSAMREAGAQLNQIHAAVGPCIGPEHYEVGGEFRENVVALNSDYEQFFHIPAGKERAHFDLPAFVTQKLKSSKIASYDCISRCTFAGESEFFSYRQSQKRSEPDYGRQISAIVIT